MPKNRKDVAVLAIAMGLLVAGITFWCRSSSPDRPIKLRMTAGDGSGLRHRLAIEFALEASKSGIQIEIKPTDGSEVAMEKISKGDFDIAFVQGGLTSNPDTNIRQISALHIEPLHLLVKPELQRSVSEKGLSQLTGRRINLGAKGSGTHSLATAVLQFAGLRANRGNDITSFVPNSLSYAELFEADFSDLPDAVFTVSTLPSPVADFLVDMHDFRLVPIPFGEAFSLEAFLDWGTTPVFGAVDKRHVYATTIPAFTYQVEPASPPEPLSTIGTRLLMVAHKRVSGDHVKRLLASLYGSSFIQLEKPGLEASLLDLPPEFPLHVGAELYRQRNKPIIAGDAIDYLEKVLAIAATVAGGTFFVVQWYLRSNRRRREASFASYMERVIQIESESMQNELAAQLDLGTLIRLQRELANLKSEAVSKFAAGELEGEGLIHGFLALVNDARNQLTRLILHQRENIEQLAATQNHSVGEVWLEQSKTAPANPPLNANGNQNSL